MCCGLMWGGLVLRVDVGRCSIEGRGHGGGGVWLGWWLWRVRISYFKDSRLVPVFEEFQGLLISSLILRTPD